MHWINIYKPLNTKNNMTPKTVTFERTYDASLEKVWQAWTEVEQLKAWWGPDGVTIPECEVDLRVGGRFYIVMEAGAAMGPFQGTRWPMEATFTVIEPEAKLSYTAKAWTEGDKEETWIDQVTEVMFTAAGGQTKVTLTATVNAVGPKAGMAVQGMEMGFNQQLDKLSAYLA